MNTVYRQHFLDVLNFISDAEFSRQTAQHSTLALEHFLFKFEGP